jgi:peptidoglycan/LPS O-acetylase OafA/YrhL
VPRVRLMEKIGGASYPIYLYHPVFVAAVVSGASARLGLSTGLLFIGGGAAGVVGPMATELAARRIRFGRLLLEGRR